MSQTLEFIAKHLNLLRDMEDVHYVNIRKFHSDIPSIQIKGMLKNGLYNTTQTLYLYKNFVRGAITGAIAGAIAYNLNYLGFKENIEAGMWLGMFVDYNQAMFRHIYQYSQVQTIKDEEKI